MISRDGDCLRVTGPLTVDTVAVLYATDLAAESGSTLTIDLASVDAADSAAVSLMLSWLRRAQRDNVMLQFANVPTSMMSLAHMYDVDGAFIPAPAREVSIPSP
jgi:phospholipid transport system transporter-binding protein